MKLKCVECGKMEVGYLIHSFRAGGKMYHFCKKCHRLAFSDSPEGVQLRDKYPRIF